MVLRGHVPEWAGAEVTQPRSESSGWKVTLSSSSCGQLHGVRPLSTAVEKPDWSCLKIKTPPVSFNLFLFNLPLAILLCCSHDNAVGCPGRCRSPLLGLLNSKFGEKWAYWSKPFPGGSVVKNLSAMPQTWVSSLGWEDPLEKEMTTHSSILAWEIPWTEEPGGVQSMGLHRVGHDWNDWAVETSRKAAIVKKSVNGPNGLKKHKIYTN